jgi:aspartyl-tRNA(Asn)/glutamyl-tRNA(Gln) amidotransferase subunit A
MTITSLHSALTDLAERRISTVELVQTLLDRLERVEPTLHNYVDIYAAAAIQHAQEADNQRARETSLPPLLGIPLGVKDIFDIAGEPTKCNSRLRASVPPATTDSVAVQTLRHDGAIILGKTVTQEFAAGVISPPARNPWDPERIPGGSSGGSAASVAAGTCLGALGSDTGGSIRIPASVTGTVGLKPTWGRLSTAGVFPLSSSLDTVGPIAKTVLDAAILYLSLARRSEEIAALPTHFEKAGESLAGKRIGILTNHFNERLQTGVAAAFNEAADQLRRLGADVIECTWEHARAARAAALLISRVESAGVHRENLRTAPELMGEDLRSRLEVGAIVPAADYLLARQVRVAATRSMAELFREQRLDAIAAPTLPATAPRVSEKTIAFPDGSTEPVAPALVRFTTPFNATGQPVVSVPCGFDEINLPIGLSFIGRPDQELALCQIAHIYERTTDWHTREPGV